MPASASYLTKYLSASNSNTTKPTSNSQSADFEESNRPKKRRKKDKSGTLNGNGNSTLLIADDDEGLLLSGSARNRPEDEDEEGEPLVYGTSVRNVEFRKKKGSDWRAVSEGGVAGGAGVEGQNGDSTSQKRQTDRDREGEEEQDEATKILNAAAQESAQRNAGIEDDDQPTIVGDITTTTTSNRPQLMSSGAPAGLQTAADTAALAAAAALTSQSQSDPKPRNKKRRDASPEPVQETIYRDASGRRIDLSQRRLEARAQQTAKIAAERAQRESAMGEVQLREREEAKRDLEEARYLGVGRDVDDEEMNERLKGEVRWDDPMAGYMAERNREKDAGGQEVGGEETRQRRTGKREYPGAAPPNRYGVRPGWRWDGVRPGWRWDGVDRGNGFEKEWFQARGKKTRNANLEYQWQYDE